MLVMLWLLNNIRANISVILLAFPSWAQEDWCRWSQHIHPPDRKGSKDSTCLLFPFHQESNIFTEIPAGFRLFKPNLLPGHFQCREAGKVLSFLGLYKQGGQEK